MLPFCTVSPGVALKRRNARERWSRPEIAAAICKASSPSPPRPSPAPQRADEVPDSSDLDEEAARPTVAAEGGGGSDSDSEESDAVSLAPSQCGDELPEWDSLFPLSLSPARLQPVQRATATHADAFAAHGVSNGVAEAHPYYGYSSPFPFAEPVQTGEVGGAAYPRHCGAQAPADSPPSARLLQGRWHTRCQILLRHETLPFNYGP